MSSNVKIAIDYTPRLSNPEHNSYRLPQESQQQPQYQHNGSQLQYSQVTYNSSSKEMESSGNNSSTRYSNLIIDQTTASNNIINNNNSSNTYGNYSSNKNNQPYLTRSQCDSSNDGTTIPQLLTGYQQSPARSKLISYGQQSSQQVPLPPSAACSQQNNIPIQGGDQQQQQQQQQVFKQNYRVSNTYRPLTASAFPLSSIPLVADYSSLRKQQQKQQPSQVVNNQGMLQQTQQQQQQQQSTEMNSGLFEQSQQNSTYQYNSQVDRRSLQGYASQSLQEDHTRLLGSQLLPNQLNRQSEGYQPIPKTSSSYQSQPSYQEPPFLNNNSSQHFAEHNNNNLILRYTGNHSQYDQSQQQSYQPLSYLNNHNHIASRLLLPQQQQPRKIESNDRLLSQQPQQLTNSSGTYSNSVSSAPVMQASLVGNAMLDGHQNKMASSPQKIDYSTESPLKQHQQYYPIKDAIPTIQSSNNISSNTKAMSASTANTIEAQQYTQAQYSQTTPPIKQNFPHSNNLQDLGMNRKQSQNPTQNQADMGSNDTSNTYNQLNSNSKVTAKEQLQQRTPLVSLTLLPIERQSAPSSSQPSQPSQQQQFSYQKDQPYSAALTAQSSTPDRSTNTTKQSTPNINSIDRQSTTSKDPSEMFLIRDQDTGQVYDIRTIDKLDQFSQTNNQEYFDKLKRRHKNVWQGWWSSKKENNIKFIDSVRCNDCALVEALLQQDLGDLKPDIDFKDPNHFAAIHYAAMNNSKEMMQILLQHDADVNINDSANQTSMIIAAERGYSQILEICLKSSGDPNRQDINLNTGLHLACRNNHNEAVRILLSAVGIDVTLRNADKKLPIECTNNTSIKQLFSQVQSPDQDKEQRSSSSIGSSSNPQLDSITSSPLQASIQSLNGLVVNQNASTTLSGYQASHAGNNNANAADKGNNNGNERELISNNNRISLTAMYSQASSQQQPTQSYHGKGQSMLHHRNTYEPLFGATGFYSQKISFQGNHNSNNTNNSGSSLPGSMSKQQSLPAKTTAAVTAAMPSVHPFSLSSSGIQLQQASATSSGINQQATIANANSNSSTFAAPSATLNQRAASNKKSQDSSDSPQNPLLQHTQSMSSSADSPQNAMNSNNSDCQVQQPWRVIIHDFTNESVLKMFNQENNNSINDNPFQNNNNNTKQNGSINAQGETTGKMKNSNENDKDELQLKSDSKGNLTNNNNNNSQSSSFQQQSSPLPAGTHRKGLSQDILASASSTQSPLLPQQPLSSNKKSNSMQQPSSSSTQSQQPPKKTQKSMSSSISSYSQFKPNIQQVSQPDQQIRVGPESFRIVNQIGRGSFGEVYLVEKRDSNGQYFAMKMLHKSKVLGQNLTKYAMTERNVLSIMSHPFIVKLMYAFQTSKDLFLIMQYMPGGDLSRALQRDKRFTENRARIYLAEILLAIRDLHKHDIIYRDLKPENIVIDSEGHANLTDFGLSKDGIYDHYSTHSFCGSLAYLAPEMLKRCGHGKAVDYYHLGVLLYEMLTGAPPFFSESKDEICHNIEFQDIRFPSHVSDSARNLISRLLVKNPAKRLGFGKNDFEEIKKHPFFQSINWSQAFQRKLKPPPPYIKPIVDSKNNSVPNFMVTMTPAGMITENHISGWSFINSLESLNINAENNNNVTAKKQLKGDKTKA